MLQAGFLKLDTRLSYGIKSKTSNVIPYASPLVYFGGIYFDHTGKRKYLNRKLSTQYYNSMGMGTVSASAGGVTLSK